MNISQKIKTTLLTPILSLKKKYIPLLLIYFAYGASGFSAIAMTFWEKENLILSTDQLITISAWILLPWTIKMIAGQLVDAVPLFGNRRKSYIFLGAGFVAIGSIILAGMAGNYDWITWIGDQFTLYLLSALFTAFGFMIQDVTADAMSTEVVETKNKKTKEIQSELAMVQILGRLALSAAILVTAGLGGVAAKHFSFETVAWMTLIIPLLSITGAVFIKLSSHESQEKSSLDPKIFGGGILFGLFSVGMAFSGIPYAQEIVFGVSFVLLSFMMHWITKDSPKKQVRTILLALFAIFLYRAMPGTGPGFSWFSIDQLGFDQVFFGILAQAGAFISFAVLWLLSDFITHKPVRAILFFLIIAGTLLDLPEMFLYLGVHEHFGISAQSITFVDNSLGSPLAGISMIPMLTLIAFYAPARHRATWFAVAASMMNLATTGGRLFTKYLNQIYVVHREIIDEAGKIVTQADYSQLGNLMITKTIIGFGIPLIAIYFCFSRKKKKLF